MVSFCTECGAKVSEDFKFCPNCGKGISLSNLQTAKKVEILLCTNCGEENSIESKVCNSCGAKLGGNRSTKAISNVEPKIASYQVEKSKIKKQTKTQPKNKPESSVMEVKKLENKKVFVFIGISLFLVLLILIASGVIDLSSNEPKESVANTQNQSPGVDLNSISKINELKNVIEKNPENFSSMLELANLRFDSGFYEEAKNDYEKYLKSDPKNADARIDMAVCYYNLRQYDKAESEILTALKYSPNHQTGFLNLGVIYLAKQNTEKAKEWFNKTVDLDPNSEIGKKAKSLLESHLNTGGN